MSSINATRKTVPVYTHNGARGYAGTPYQQLIRTTMTCMLWEDQFYENGVSIAERIKQLVYQCSLADAASVAIEARNNMKLRHVPLLIVREMARHPKLKTDPRVVSTTLAHVIQRPDELSEFLSIYWKDGKCPLSKQVKLGLAKAFQKFGEYDLAKYNRKKDVMLRDVLFLCHSKPADVTGGVWTKNERKLFAENPGAAQKRLLTQTGHADGFTPGELLYGKLVYDQLETPDTWEVELSQSKDKKESWLRLLNEKKLGDLAFLRNLRNMSEAGINNSGIASYGDTRKWGRVLPFRFIAAARMMPQFEPHLEQWMFKCLEGQKKLPGRTVFMVDVSGSMFGRKVSAKSDLDRFDAAAALAILGRELCEDVLMTTFSHKLVVVPPRRGFALRDALSSSQPHGGTYLGQAIQALNTNVEYDRLIVITDEQSSDPIVTKIPCGYIINVGSYQNGIQAKGGLLRISGWSEAVFDYIAMLESQE